MQQALVELVWEVLRSIVGDHPSLFLSVVVEFLQLIVNVNL